MTEQTTTTYPTPLRDAARALREEHNVQYAEFVAARRPVLDRTLTKDEAVDLAVTKYVDATRSSLSKKDAIDEIVDGEWNETEIAAKMREAERMEGREGIVIRAIQRPSETAAYHHQQMVEVLANEHLRYNTDQILRTAFDLQSSLLKAVWWERVSEHILEGGLSPLDALASVREQAVKEALNPFANRLVSRSTSLAANLTEDQRRIAAVEFLDDTERLVRGF